jgi:outer membrane beta-barrel protein
MNKKIGLWLCLQFLTFNVFASQKDVYDFSWLDQDKEIYVLQNRRYRKVDKFYVGLTGGKTISGAFVDALQGGVSAGYFFKENWGVEFVYNKADGATNNTYESVKDAGTLPYYRKVDSYMGAMLMWSPFYSKINTFNKIFYFDWIFGVGGAQINTLNNKDAFEVNKEEGLASETGMGALWTSGLRFYVNESWSLRLDIRGIHVSSKQPQYQASDKTVWFHNYDMGVGVNFSF